MSGSHRHAPSTRARRTGIGTDGMSSAVFPLVRDHVKGEDDPADHPRGDNGLLTHVSNPVSSYSS
jgi:hypothetical protein